MGKILLSRRRKDTQEVRIELKRTRKLYLVCLKKKMIDRLSNYSSQYQNRLNKSAKESASSWSKEKKKLWLVNGRQSCE